MHPEWHSDWFRSPCIDLRDSQEFIHQHINNTTSLPWSRLCDSMHELPDKHQELQLLGDEEALHSAAEFLALKGYVVSRKIVSDQPFWRWADEQQLIRTGCDTVPLWRANPLLENAITTIESRADGRTALDFACGAGRDAVFLARRGWDVTAIDIKEDALKRCRTLAESSGTTVTTRQADMEQGFNHLQGQAYDLIVVMRYLHRPFLPKLINHLKPNGLLCYSTFMVGCEVFGSPRNPNFLLEPNELADTFPTMEHIMNDEHKLEDGRPVAWFLGQKRD